ncbi:hypothetical protein QQX98_009814 [Neonectria punicea]|uniref:DUF7708 domain-containing protein n=1 Tax=Neonectria punicea TaxID=979145 RepID=A0ABR1GRN8_9HYPO
MDLNAVFYPWYLEYQHTTGLAGDAFKAAKEHFGRSSSLNDQEKALLAGASSIEDVQQVVADSLTKYEAKGDSSKIRKWLHKASEIICHYGTILDVFVQHHPEYVALVWGTMKLLFTSVVNHGETLKLLAKCVSQVAARLPRINILSTLYPTKHMKAAVESLYSHILEFLLIAHEWCNESKFRHFYHSFTQPHELRYNDLLERITDCSNTILELAAVGSQAEIHVMYKTQSRKLDYIVSKLEAAEDDRKSQIDGLTHALSRLEASDRNQDKKSDLIISLLEASGLTISDLLVKIETFHSIQSSAQLNTNQQLSDLQLSQVLSTFSLTFEDPEKCYKTHLLLRKRRASGMGANTSTNKFWLSPKLSRWSSSHDSAVVLIKGSFKSRLAMHDFSIDVIRTLTTSAVPTIWALTSVEKSRASSILTTMDLIKYLTYQALRMGRGAKTEKHISLQYSQFHTAQTPKACLELFRQVVANLGGQLYLVLDLAAVRASLVDLEEFDFIQELSQMLSNGFKQGMKTRVKVLLLVYEVDWFRHLSNNVSKHVIPVKITKSRGPQSKQMRDAMSTRVFPGRGARAGTRREGH